MLTIAELKHPSEKTVFLEQFDAETSTWIVSDLRNKFEIQQHLLEKQGFYEEASVLRASEFWKLLLKRSRPEMKLVSSDFILTWVQEQMKNLVVEDSNLRFGTSAHQVVIEMMDLMAGVHAHPEGPGKLREWFQENPEGLQRWGGWYLLSERFFQSLSEKNLFSVKWAAAFLQSESQWKNFWKRPLIFDLGSQMSQVEADLIHNLSRHFDVIVLAPDPSWKAEYEYLLKPYSFLQAHSYSRKNLLSAQHGCEMFSQALKFSGVLAETKKACELVRAWLELGIEAHKIAIVAGDIEKYWPLLQPLLQAEGVPVTKDLSVRLQSLPAVSQWLAELRIALKEIRYSDLESALFQHSADSPHPLIRFDDFHSLFSELISAEDLRRHYAVENAFDSDFRPNDQITRDEWIGFSAARWKNKKDFSALETCFKEILANTDSFLKMRASAWVHLTEQIASKKELRLSKSERNGIHLTNLNSGDSLLITHRIFLGLTESMLKNQTSQLLAPREIMSISSELGFSLEHPEVSSWDFDLNWLAENPTTSSYYFFPQTGFSAGAEAPCSLWLKRAGQQTSESQGRADDSIRIRWDFLLRTKKIEAESFPSKTVTLAQPLSLSPSSIETYRRCPFLFAVQKIFRLSDLPLMDLDVDRRVRGQLAHALLEDLTEEPRVFSRTDDEIREKIDRFRDQLGMAKMDEFIWQGLRERHVNLAQRFLKFEQIWQNQFPQTKVLAREQEFEFFWDFHSQSFAKAGAWKIRGRIDRLDGDHRGRLVLIDYKMTAGDYKHHSKWIEKNQLQLALYMLALEEGAIEQWEPKEVVGAFFYVLKNMNRDRGLKVEEAAGSLFEVDRKGSRIKGDQKSELLKTVKEIIGHVLNQIREGHFSPVPLEPEKCGECQWRNLCRAPHMN